MQRQGVKLARRRCKQDRPRQLEAADEEVHRGAAEDDDPSPAALGVVVAAQQSPRLQAAHGLDGDHDGGSGGRAARRGAGIVGAVGRLGAVGEAVLGQAPVGVEQRPGEGSRQPRHGEAAVIGGLLELGCAGG